MWNDFSDFELAELAGRYGLENSLVFAGDRSLANREQVECLVEEVEYHLAFDKESV